MSASVCDCIDIPSSPATGAGATAVAGESAPAGMVTGVDLAKGSDWSAEMVTGAIDLHGARAMWDALGAARPFLLWAKERGAICGDVISMVEQQIAANRSLCAPQWSKMPANKSIPAK